MSKAKDTLLSGQDADNACIYACLMLHDAGQEISAENIRSIIKAAHMKLEFPAFANVYARYFERNSVASALARKADTAPAAAPAAAAGDAPAAGGAAKPAAKAAVVEEENTDFGMDLF